MYWDHNLPNQGSHAALSAKKGMFLIVEQSFDLYITSFVSECAQNIVSKTTTGAAMHLWGRDARLGL